MSQNYKKLEEWVLAIQRDVLYTLEDSLQKELSYADWMEPSSDPLSTKAYRLACGRILRNLQKMYVRLGLEEYPVKP